MELEGRKGPLLFALINAFLLKNCMGGPPLLLIAWYEVANENENDE